MFRPPFLHIGDTIALLSPAGRVLKEYVDYTVELFNSWGFKTVLAKNALNACGPYAGSISERTEDMQEALDNENIKAIYCMGASYGAMEVRENLDYSLLQASPKWLIASHELTVFHEKFNLLGIETIYAPMASELRNLGKIELDNMSKILQGQLFSYRVDAHDLNQCGIVQGFLIGGSIKVMQHFMPKFLKSKLSSNILFLDMDADIYEVLEILQILHVKKQLHNIQGIIVGGNLRNVGETDCKSRIMEVLSKYDFPICFAFSDENQTRYPLVLGANAQLLVKNDFVELIMMQT